MHTHKKIQIENNSENNQIFLISNVSLFFHTLFSPDAERQ